MEATKTYNNGFEKYSELMEQIKRKCTYGNLLGHVRDSSAIIRKHYVLENELHVYLEEDSIIVSAEELCSKDENYTYEERQGKSEIYMEFNERLRDCQLRINGESSIRVKYGEEPKYSEILGKEGRDYYYLPTDVAKTGMDKSQDEYEVFGEITDDMHEILEAAVGRAENEETKKAYKKALELHDRAARMVDKTNREIVEPPVNLEELSKDELVSYLESVKSKNQSKEADLRKREIILQIKEEQQQEKEIDEEIEVLEGKKNEPENGFEKYKLIAENIRALCGPDNMVEIVTDSYSKQREHYVLENGLHVYVSKDSIVVSDEVLFSKDSRFSQEERREKAEVVFELNEAQENCKLQFNKGYFDTGDRKIFYRSGGKRDYCFLPPDMKVYAGDRSLDKYVERGSISDDMEIILNGAIVRSEDAQTKDLYKRGLTIHQQMMSVLNKNERKTNEELLQLSEEELVQVLELQKAKTQSKREKLERLELIKQIKSEMQIGLDLDEKIKALDLNRIEK